MKDNTFKLAVLTCLVVLVAIVGVSAYVFINNEPKTLNNVSSPNQSLQNNSNSTNSTSNTVTPVSKKSDSNNAINNSIYHLISPEQATEIANNYAAQYGEEVVPGAIGLINGVGKYGGADGDPYYHVSLKSIDPNQHIEGYVEVDAITGAINPRGS